MLQPWPRRTEAAANRRPGSSGAFSPVGRHDSAEPRSAHQTEMVRPVIRAFLLTEAIVFALAALVHRGILLDGYRHQQAFVAETVIALVLAGAVGAGVAAPRVARVVGLGAQAFALVGTCVGLVAIAVGVGPRTVPDLVYHLAIVAVLLVGIVLGARRSGTRGVR
jgi:hypothetical protein